MYELNKQQNLAPVTSLSKGKFLPEPSAIDRNKFFYKKNVKCMSAALFLDRPSTISFSS